MYLLLKVRISPTKCHNWGHALNSQEREAVDPDTAPPLPTMTALLSTELCETVELPHLLLLPPEHGATLLEENLLDAGYVVTTVADEQEALQLMFQLSPDYVIHGHEVMARTGRELFRLRTIVEKSSRPPPLPA